MKRTVCKAGCGRRAYTVDGVAKLRGFCQPCHACVRCHECGDPLGRGSRGSGACHLSRGGMEFCSMRCSDRHSYRWYDERLQADPAYFLRGEEGER